MSQPSWIGYTLSGRYRIEDLLGQGGMSAVYKGTDPNLRRTVAIKLIHGHLSSDPEFVRRFEQEAAAVAQLRHPNIIQVFDFNHDGDTYYMVLEFLPGETLLARMRSFNASGRRMPVAEIVPIMAAVCDAVAYAHAKGMVHRDLKPANVMLNPQGEPTLMDFGVARMMGGQSHTATGAVIGTVAYMSPEQVRGERVDERSDLYSLGIMLYELAAGRPPFEGDSAMTVMLKHLNEPVPDLRQFVADVPDSLAAIIEKALAKDPAQRFQTAGAMARALRGVEARPLPSAPVEAAPPLPPAEARPLPSAPVAAAPPPVETRALPSIPIEAAPPPPPAAPTAAVAAPPTGAGAIGSGTAVSIVSGLQPPPSAQLADVSTSRAPEPMPAPTPVANPPTSAPPARQPEPPRVEFGATMLPPSVAASSPPATASPVATPPPARNSGATLSPAAPARKAGAPTAAFVGVGIVAFLVVAVFGGFMIMRLLRRTGGAAAATATRAVVTSATTGVKATAAATQPATDVAQPTAAVATRPAATNAPAATAVPTPTAAPAVPDGMVLIPAGSFNMGFDGGAADERPVHPVTLGAFFMDQFEVTNARYKACADAGACALPARASSDTRASYFDNPDFADYPVIRVTWAQAARFCAWDKKRLPTEAEWEYAATGGDGRRYPWGNDFNAAFVPSTIQDTVEVGSHPENVSPFGVFDMAGNVVEWVSDWYGRAYYARAPELNPPGPETGAQKVLRGGSFGTADQGIFTTTRRYNQPAGFQDVDVGFRCVADMPR